MLLINKLTDDTFQKLNLVGLPGITIASNLSYYPRIKRWALDISYNNFTLNGLLVTTSPNMLRQYRNLIPFGIACVSNNKLDPFQQSDFISGACNLYLLDATDVATVEQYYTGS